MELKEFFAAHPKIALAFSGGVDSAYLLYAAKQLGAEVRAYYVKTAFQPQFELDDAKRLVEALHADMTSPIRGSPQIPPTAVTFAKSRFSRRSCTLQARTALPRL